MVEGVLIVGPQELEGIEKTIGAKEVGTFNVSKSTSCLLMTVLPDWFSAESKVYRKLTKQAKKLDANIVLITEGYKPDCDSYKAEGVFYGGLNNVRCSGALAL